MSAADALSEMLAVGQALIPTLVEDTQDHAPDLEAYLRALEQFGRTHLTLMKLRQAEQDQGVSGPGVSSLDEAMSVLLATSVTTRRDLIARLQASVPARGMKDAT